MATPPTPRRKNASMIVSHDMGDLIANTVGQLSLGYARYDYRTKGSSTTRPWRAGVHLERGLLADGVGRYGARASSTTCPFYPGRNQPVARQPGADGPGLPRRARHGRPGLVPRYPRYERQGRRGQAQLAQAEPGAGLSAELVGRADGRVIPTRPMPGSFRPMRWTKQP